MQPTKIPDLTQAQVTVQAASARAGAYLSSWGSWAAEKRKTGWRGSGASSGADEAQTPAQPQSQSRRVEEGELREVSGVNAQSELGESSRAGAR